MQQTITTQSKIAQLKQQYIHDYSIKYKSLLQSSWRLTKGAKSRILLALLLVMIIGSTMSHILQLVTFYNVAINQLLQLILGQLLLQPLTAGIWLLGIQRATGEKIKISTLFSIMNWYYIGHIFIGYAWQVTLYIFIGLVAVGILKISGNWASQNNLVFNAPTSIVLGLALIAALYVTAIYFMTIPLIVTQHIPGWQALTLSRIATNRHFFKLLGLFLLHLLIIALASFLTLGIALIWLMPWSVILQGRIFMTVFLSTHLSHTEK